MTTEAQTTDEAAFAAIGAALAAPATPGATDLLPEPLAPEAATARIAELKKDPAFLERYLGGEVAARDEFTRLHSQASKAPINPDAVHRSLQIGALQKHADLPPAAWAQVAANGPVYQGERDFALQEKQRCFKDKAWVAKWLDGDRAAVSHLTRLSLIIASPVKPEGA